MNFVLRSSLLSALAAAVWVGFGSINQPVLQLQAAQNPAHVDSDGDLLPDTLEWVLLSDPTRADSDADGVDDFLEAVQFGAPAPMDHEMRASVHADKGDLYLDLMVRWVPGEAIGDLGLFLQFGELEVSLNHIFMAQLANLQMVRDPEQGTYLMASARMCQVDQISALLPCTVGARGSIGARDFGSGIVLDQVDGVLVGLVPLPGPGPKAFALHPIDASDHAETAGPEGNEDGGEGEKRFWASSKTCKIQLVPVGSGGGSTVTEVLDAGCTGAPTMRCAPSCGDWKGKVYVVPDVLPYLSGK